MKHSFTFGNKKIELKPVEDVVVVAYKKSASNAAINSRISSKRESKLPGVTIKAFPKYKIALVTRPPFEPHKSIMAFSKSMSKDRNVSFVSKAYREALTGSLMIVTDEINIQFKNIDQPTIEKIISDNDLSVVQKESEISSGQYLVKVKTSNQDKVLEKAHALNKLKEVEFAEPNFLSEFRKSNIAREKYFKKQWYLNNTGQGKGKQKEDVRALGAWEISRGNPAIVIAIIDDGVHLNHPNLKGNIWENPDTTAGDKHGHNFYDGTDDPNPIYFSPPYDSVEHNDIHGTPCAGVAAAVGESVKGVYGIAYKCKILAVKIFGEEGLTPSNILAKAIRYAGRHADILSCSWSCGPSNAVKKAINDVSKNGRGGLGCPVFAATGNNSPDPVAFPALEPEIIAVGASTNLGKRAFYSQYGPEIDFVAPSDGGTLNIFTTDVGIPTRGFNLGKPGQGDKKGYYTKDFGGTSSATPLAAGIGALVLSTDPKLKSHKVRQILRDSCDKIDKKNGNYDSKGFSLMYGYGRLNARKALQLAKK